MRWLKTVSLAVPLKLIRRATCLVIWMEPRQQVLDIVTQDAHRRSRSRSSGPHWDYRELGAFIWFTPNAIDHRNGGRRTSVNVSLLPLGRIKWNNRTLPVAHSWHLVGNSESEEHLVMCFNARGEASRCVNEHRLMRITSQSRVTDCWELVLLNNQPPGTEQQAYMLLVHSGLLATQF